MIVVRSGPGNEPGRAGESRTRILIQSILSLRVSFSTLMNGTSE